MDELDDNQPVASQQADSLLEWMDYEYQHSDKDSNWFWLVGLIGLLAIILAIVFKNFLFAVILLISTFTLMLYGARQPELIHFRLTSKGLKAKNEIYLFNNLKSFALQDEEEPYKLMIESNRLILPHIIIPLGDIEPAVMRQFLSKYLPEEPFHESVIDKLSEHLGF